MIQGAQTHSADEVHRALDRILARPEFDREPTQLMRLLDWLAELFDFDASGETATTLLWIFFLVVGLLLGYGLYRLWRAVAMDHQEGTSDEDGVDVRERVSLLRADARTAEQAGDLRTALRLYLFALVVGLGEQGSLRYHAAWTNRELLERGRPSRSTHDLLAPLIIELEAKEFGHEPILPADVARLRALCEEHLGPQRGQAA